MTTSDTLFLNVLLFTEKKSLVESLTETTEYVNQLDINGTIKKTINIIFTIKKRRIYTS